MRDSSSWPKIRSLSWCVKSLSGSDDDNDDDDDDDDDVEFRSL